MDKHNAPVVALEERYTVVKHTHATRIVGAHWSSKTVNHILNKIGQAIDKGEIYPYHSIVIESDWPEYEPVKQALLARINGNKEGKLVYRPYSVQVEGLAPDLQEFLRLDENDKYYLYTCNLSLEVPNDDWIKVPEGCTICIKTNCYTFYKVEKGTLYVWDVDLGEPGEWARSTYNLLEFNKQFKTNIIWERNTRDPLPWQSKPDPINCRSLKKGVTEEHIQREGWIAELTPSPNGYTQPMPLFGEGQSPLHDVDWSKLAKPWDTTGLEFGVDTWWNTLTDDTKAQIRYQHVTAQMKACAVEPAEPKDLLDTYWDNLSTELKQSALRHIGILPKDKAQAHANVSEATLPDAYDYWWKELDTSHKASIYINETEQKDVPFPLYSQLMGRAKRTGNLSDLYPHYHKDVSYLNSVDVYRVLELFNVVNHPQGHAIKKLLCAGQRGEKSYEQDIKEARDTCNRILQMLAENENATK